MKETTLILADAQYKEKDIVEKRTSRGEELFLAAQRYSEKEMSDDLYNEGGSFRTLIKNEMNLNEAARHDIVDDLNAHVKRMNGRFKPSMERMEAALTLVDGKMISWAREQAKKLKLDRVPSVATSEGTVSVVKRWAFEIVDVNKIPKRYWIIDEKAIGKDVRGGVRRINGVKIFQKEGLTQ